MSRSASGEIGISSFNMVENGNHELKDGVRGLRRSSIDEGTATEDENDADRFLSSSPD